MGFHLEVSVNGQTQQFRFDGDSVSIGRDRNADFVIDHPTVSRQHAMITRGYNGFQLVVLSRGGMTALDGQQVSGEVPLFDGSELFFGNQQFTFRSPEAPQRPQQQANPSGGWQQQQPVDPSGGWQQQQQPADPSGGWQQQQQPADPSGGWQQQQQPANPSGGWEQQQQPADPSGGWQQQQQPANPSGGWQQQPANPSGGWQSQPNSGGWDQQPANGGGGWQEQAGSDGWSTADASGGEVESWHSIAERADQKEQQQRGPTDHAKIEEALKEKKKTSPMLILVTVAMVGFLGYLFIADATKPQEKVVKATFEDPTGEISVEVDCIGEASCKGDAINAFKVGDQAVERVGADISNLYEAHFQFTKARKMLERGNISNLPPEMKGIDKAHEAVREKLQREFQQQRVNYLDARKKKDKKRMKSALDTIMAYVPDESCDYNKWAQKEEDWMKDKNLYPRDIELPAMR